MSWRAICALLLLGQALDTLTLLWFVQVAPPGSLESSEMNRLIVWFYAVGGVALVAFVKLGLPTIVYIWRDKLRRPLFRKWVVPFAVLSGFIGAAFNLLSIASIIGAQG